MATSRLTQAAVDRLGAPKTGRVIYWDRLLPGFGCRVTATGSKSWVAMYRVNGKAVMETIGPLARIPKVDDARQRARESMTAAATGENPVKVRKVREEQAAVSTFGAVAERYIERHARKHTKPVSWRELERQLRLDVLPRWGDRPIATITRQMVSDLIDGIEARGAPIQANRTLARLKALFAWAVREELVETDPTARVDKVVKERARDRTLADVELGWFWSACDDLGWPFGAMGKLLLLTAQRRDEVSGMQWSELDLPNRLWTIPRERAKNDRAHEVHLTDLAMEVIEALPRIGAKPQFVLTTTGETPVSGYSKAKAAIDRGMMMARLRAEAPDLAEMVSEDRLKLGEAFTTLGEGEGVEPWVFHDLRRTAATSMARLNVLPHVVDRLLNHVSGEIRGVAAVYNRHAYLDERKAALETWGRFVASLVRPGASNVVPMVAAAG